MIWGGGLQQSEEPPQKAEAGSPFQQGRRPPEAPPCTETTTPPFRPLPAAGLGDPPPKSSGRSPLVLPKAGPALPFPSPGPGTEPSRPVGSEEGEPRGLLGCCLFAKRRLYPGAAETIIPGLKEQARFVGQANP